MADVPLFSCAVPALALSTAQIKIEFEINPNARLSDPAPPRSPGGRIGAHERLEQQQRELAALDLDVREEALQGKLERAERNAARSRDASPSPRSSHSGRSRSRSHGSRSPSRSRSRSRSHGSAIRPIKVATATDHCEL